MADLVGSVLFAVLFPLGMWAVFRFSRRPPELDGEATTLRHGPAVAVLGWVSVGLGVLMLGGVAVGSVSGELPAVIVATGGVGLALGLGGAWLLAAHRREYVRLSQGEIEGRSGWAGGPVSIRWEEVDSARFRPLAGYLVLRSQDGRVVRVSPLLHGSSELAALLERRVHATGVAEAARAFRQYQAAYGGAQKR